MTQKFAHMAQRYPAPLRLALSPARAPRLQLHVEPRTRTRRGHPKPQRHQADAARVVQGPGSGLRGIFHAADHAFFLLHLLHRTPTGFLENAVLISASLQYF